MFTKLELIILEDAATEYLFKLKENIDNTTEPKIIRKLKNKIIATDRLRERFYALIRERQELVDAIKEIVPDVN